MNRRVSSIAARAVGHLPTRVQHDLAQAITDGRLAGRRWKRVARALVKYGGDPAVEFSLAGSTLQLPLSSPLPEFHRQSPPYSMNIGEVARLVADLGGRTMIDVGANVGDSVAIVKARAPEMAILCVEADPVYLPFLEANTARWADVEIAGPVLLADRSDVRSGALRRTAGTSRFDASAAGSCVATTLDDLLRQRTRFATPALLKSDTDGFEGHVLSGAHSLLSTSAPVLFLEYDPVLLDAAGSNGLRVLATLRDLGYERIAFYDKFGLLVARCSLSDVGLIADLHAYAAENPIRGVDHFDVVVATAAYRSVVDNLRPDIPAP